jgi:MPBQ/MSBQ methyltransferase
LSEETSFVGKVKDYRDALQHAGFRVTQERGRGPFAFEFTERVKARMAQGGPPALGLHLLISEKAPILAGNMLTMMKEGVLEPVELYARAV